MRRDEGNPLRALRIVLTWGLLVALLWVGGLFWFAAKIVPVGLPNPTTDFTADDRAQAIVVLTGGRGRLQAGFALLEHKAGEQLFISGVYDGVAVRELMDLTFQSRDEFSCCVSLGYAADNTIGNAAETAEWSAERRITTLRLVTANYHMPRALLEFAMAMPDATIIPHPISSPNVKITDWWRWPGTAHLIAVEYSKYLLTWVRWRLASLITA